MLRCDLRAFGEGHVDAIRILPDLGLEPNGANNDGRKALMGAAMKGRNDAVLLLVQRGAGLAQKDHGSRDTDNATSSAAGQPLAGNRPRDGLVRVGAVSGGVSGDVRAHPEVMEARHVYSAEGAQHPVRLRRLTLRRRQLAWGTSAAVAGRISFLRPEMLNDESWKQLREKVHRVNRRLAAARTEAALLRLTEDERKAVVGSCELHLSYEELATMLGEPSPETARAAVLRAVNRFVREFER